MSRHIKISDETAQLLDTLKHEAHKIKQETEGRSRYENKNGQITNNELINEALTLLKRRRF